MHFGATLRLLRLDAGFTLRDLAEQVGVSNAYLSRVENGHDAPPSPDRLVALARVLGLPPATLIELADRFVPFAVDYLERMPAARQLMIEIVRRNPTPMDLARIRAFVDRALPDRDGAGRVADWPAKFFAPERVIIGLRCDELDDAIDVAAMRLAPELGVDAAEVARRIRERECACSSALGGGLAVPYSRIARARPRAVVLTLYRPLDVGAPDHLPVGLLVVHVHGDDSASKTALSRLARLARQEVIDRIRLEHNPAKVIDAIRGAT